ncbi:MAG: FtsQ-type POTRA domain-containing protein, partial [Nocardioidaceae bacterium]
AGRWLAWRLVVIAVLGVGVVAVATWLVFFSAVLAVEGVRVEGNEVLSAAAVRRAADVPLGAPLATADLDAVTARVARLRAVRTVDVSRSWPDRVRIAVRERRAVAVVERDGTGRLRGVDADGVAFRGYAARPTGLPRIRVGRRAGQEAVAEAAAVAGALPADVARRVAFIRVQTVDTISLRLRDGRTVRWGSAEDSADKSRVLAVLLGQQAGYYDVSVPGRPVIRR